LLDSDEKYFDDSFACLRWLAGRLDLVKAATFLPSPAQRTCHQAVRPIVLPMPPREGREIGEILLDSPGNHLDDLDLWQLRLAGGSPSSRRVGCTNSGNLLMSDEMPVNSTVAEFPSPRAAAAIESVGNGSQQAIAAEWASSHSHSPTVAPTAEGSCASYRATEARSQKSCNGPSCRAKLAAGVSGLVFVLGEISFDLVTESRRNSIRQHMERDQSNPIDPAQMLAYLAQNPWEAASIIWTLSFDQTPIYAINPVGPFAAEGYDRLREFMADHVAGTVERVLIPGRLAGQARLFNGQVLPVVVPELRGMYSWTTALVLQRRVSRPTSHAAPSQLGEAPLAMGCGGLAIPLPPPVGPP
jgi:PatG Domain